MEKKQKIEIGIMGVFTIFIVALLGLLAWNSMVLSENQKKLDDLNEVTTRLAGEIWFYNDQLGQIIAIYLEECPECLDKTCFQLDPIIEGTNLSFVFYDNHNETFRTSPIFTPDNWLNLPEWTMAQPDDTFTQPQKTEIMMLTLNLAYYKETGTWLGE